MHPEVQQEISGMCPECGMQLVLQKVGSKYSKKKKEKHNTHNSNKLLYKFWGSLALTIPVLFYADIIQNLFGWSDPVFPGSEYVPLVLGTIIFFWGGWDFLSSAYRELKGRLPGMMTLISLAIVTAYSWSVYVVMSGEGKTLFWELSTLIVIMLLGHWIEARAVGSAQSALKELSKLLPDKAERVTPHGTEIVELRSLKVSDEVVVKPGGKVPVDGVVVSGSSRVNESLVTGESKPQKKEVNMEVIAGSVNENGVLQIRVTRIGERTFLAGVMRLVAEAQASKSRIQSLADKAALYLTGIAVVTGLTTIIAWIVLGAGFGFAIERMVAVLVIACPHALGLAIPLVSSISTTKAARNGFLVRDKKSLESARNVSTVLFDKTGTLTYGEYGVQEVFVHEVSSSKKEIIQHAASIEQSSEHPAARAIVEYAKAKKVGLGAVSNFKRLPGKGVQGVLKNNLVKVGGERIIANMGSELDKKFLSNVEVEAKKGNTIIYVVKEKECLGAIVLADKIRKESKTTIQLLKKRGVSTAMITGDSEQVAKWVAKDLDIDQYFARVMPKDKSSKVKELQSQGKTVAFVGDGINDAPALAQSDVGIAIGAGTNVAIESAGIILIKNDPRDIGKIISLSHRTYSKMIQNLFWAAGYNIVAIPLAAGVAYSAGILLSPAVGAVFMSLSTVIVAFNAVLLRNAKL